MESGLCFSAITEDQLLHLWTQGHAETGWPLRDVSWSAFEAWSLQNSFSLASDFCNLSGIFLDNQTCIGFLTRQQIPPEYLPPLDPATCGSAQFPRIETALECGTYLLPSYRGRGLNGEIKEKVIREELESGKCQMIGFVVPIANVQAGRAMRKLPWSVEIVTSNAHPASHPLARFARFRAYQESAPVDVFLYTNHS